MNFEVINPFDKSVLKSYSHHNLDEALQKIKSFHEKQKAWGKKPVSERAETVKKVAVSVRANKESLAVQASLEMGKPIVQSRLEVEKCAVTLEMLADLAVEELKEKTIAAHYSKTILRPEAYGLVFSIQPWNFPYWQALRMAACAWMSGNTVVLKHADAVSGCAELIEKVTSSVNPDLLLNLRLSHEDAAKVIESSMISIVTLTGSTKAGKEVGSVAGKFLKKQILELGGSDAYILMPDCDFEKSLTTCVKGRLTNSGQSCIAAKRFFVHESLFEKFKTSFIEKLKVQKMGDPMKEETQIGPLSAEKFVEAINKQIEKAKQEGVKYISAQDPINKGFSPIGILDFEKNLTAFNEEEIFGPVASIYSFSNIGEAIEAINKGPYGLGGGIFTNDINLANEVASQIVTGTFTINTYAQSDARVPFGGTKESGIGCELGAMGLNNFTLWKVIGTQ